MKTICQVFIFFVLVSMDCFAQANKKVPTLNKPNAILFMLNTSDNKIYAMKKRGLYDEIKEVEAIDKDINKSIMLDFSKYFNYCPVYFFYSNQFDLVKSKKWEDVVFYDYEHLKMNKKIEVSSLGNYLIAEVNYPPTPDYDDASKDGVLVNSTDNAGFENEFANSRDYGIILYDDQFKLMKGKLQFTNISLALRGSILKASERKYKFVGAKKFAEVLKVNTIK